MKNKASSKRPAVNSGIVGILFVSLLAARCSLLAASSSAGAFLKIDPSARSYALGQTGVVNALGAESIGVNPANLMGMSRKMEVLTSYTSVTEGVDYGHIAGSINRSVNSNLMVDAIGFSYTRLAVSGLEGRDSQGNKTSDFGSQDSNMTLSLSGNAGKLQMGMTGKIVQSKISSYKANTAFAMDLGMNYSFKSMGRNMRLGGSISNLGQKVKYVDQADSLPTTANLGLNTNVGPLNLTGGLKQEMKGGTTMNFGMEFNMGLFAVRAGMNSLAGAKGNKASGNTGIFEGLSSGIGMHLGMARMDYAIGQSSADLGISHRMSLTMQFGKKSR